MHCIEKIFFTLNKDTGRLVAPIINTGSPVNIGFYSRKIKFDIFRETNDKEENIGFIEGCFYNIEKMIDDNCSPYQVLKDMDEQTQNMVLALYDPWKEDFREGYIGNGYNIFYVKRLYIYKEYRGMGLGSKVLHGIEPALNYIFDYPLGCIVLKPIPFEVFGEQDVCFDENELLCRRVNKFYKKNGFKPVEDAEYMYLNTN